MNLDEGQKQKVADWIKDGLKLSEIQSRLAAEMGIRMTYMEVRLLVNDLQLVPKDPEPPKAESLPKDSNLQTGPQATSETSNRNGITLTADQIARPGAIVSGKVTFTDGKKAEWYLDQSGRLGLVPEQAGYRPTTTDLKDFQVLLEAELAKLGF